MADYHVKMARIMRQIAHEQCETLDTAAKTALLGGAAMLTGEGMPVDFAKPAHGSRAWFAEYCEGMAVAERSNPGYSGASAFAHIATLLRGP